MATAQFRYFWHQAACFLVLGRVKINYRINLLMDVLS
jgi:hypothetical protein